MIPHVTYSTHYVQYSKTILYNILKNLIENTFNVIIIGRDELGCDNMRK